MPFSVWRNKSRSKGSYSNYETPHSNLLKCLIRDGRDSNLGFLALSLTWTLGSVGHLMACAGSMRRAFMTSEGQGCKSAC